MKQRELIIDGAFLALGVFSIIHSESLPKMGAVSLSPGIFPMIIGFLLVLFSLVSGASLIAKRAAGRETAGSVKERSVPLIVSMFAAYAILISLIHFIPASIAFAVAAMVFMKRRITVSIVAVSVASVAIIYVLFMYVFHVRLP